jgi:hypothetical protein
MGRVVVSDKITVDGLGDSDPPLMVYMFLSELSNLVSGVHFEGDEIITLQADIMHDPGGGFDCRLDIVASSDSQDLYDGGIDTAGVISGDISEAIREASKIYGRSRGEIECDWERGNSPNWLGVAYWNENDNVPVGEILKNPIYLDWINRIGQPGYKMTHLDRIIYQAVTGDDDISDIAKHIDPI